MSSSFSLFRVTNGFLRIPPDQRFSALNEEVVLPFGSCSNIVERLCTVSGFSRNFAEEETSLRLWKESDIRHKSKPLLAWITYSYQQDNIYGRVSHYTIWNDPISCIMVNQKYIEDSLPIIDVLKDLEPFLALNPVKGKLISPNEFKYSKNEWLHKNSKEDALTFKY